MTDANASTVVFEGLVELATRPCRSGFGALVYAFVLIGIAGLAPLTLWGVTSCPWLIPERDQATRAADMGAGAGSSEEERAEIEAALKAGCPPEGCSATEVAARSELRARLATLEKQAAEPSSDAMHDKAGARRLRLGSGLALSLLMALGAAGAQSLLALRFWAKAVWRRGEYPQETDRRSFTLIFGCWLLMLALAVVTMVVAPVRISWACVAVAMLSVPFLAGWVKRASPLTMGLWAIGLGAWLGAQAVRGLGVDALASTGGVAAVALCALLVFQLSMAALLTHVVAGNVPSGLMARSFRLLIDSRRWDLAEEATYTGAPSTPGELGLWKKLSAELELRKAQEAARAKEEKKAREEQRAPIERKAYRLEPAKLIPGLSPKAAAEVVEDVSRVAMLTIVAALLPVAVFMESPAGEGAAAKAVSELHTAQLVATAVAATLSMCVIYLLPAMRLRPFEEAEALLSKPAEAEPEYIVAPVVVGFSIEPKQKAEKSAADLQNEEQADRALAACLGCDAQGLDILYAAGRRGGGLHEVLQAGGSGWVKSAATVLAPAFAAGLFSALF